MSKPCVGLNAMMLNMPEDWSLRPLCSLDEIQSSELVICNELKV